MDPAERDYYSILGVSPTARSDEITQAYRRMALKCHPDRGGSHEQMILVNEAHEILSNPEWRIQYDHIRSASVMAPPSSTWSDVVNNARKSAKDYPRDWQRFKKWMSTIIDDVNAAKYTQTEIGDGLKWQFPTIDNSISGNLFIWGGLIFGILLAYLVYLVDTVHYNIFGLLGLVFLGAWGGQFAHRMLGRFLKRQRSSPDVFACSSCGRMLRVPFQLKQVEVTCPTCKAKFSHAADPQEQIRRLEKRVILLARHRLYLVCAISLLALIMSIIGIEFAKNHAFENIVVFTGKGYYAGYKDAMSGIAAPKNGDELGNRVWKILADQDTNKAGESSQ